MSTEQAQAGMRQGQARDIHISLSNGRRISDAAPVIPRIKLNTTYYAFFFFIIIIISAVGRNLYRRCQEEGGIYILICGIFPFLLII